MLWRKTLAGVAANLIIGIALLMSGGASPVLAELLITKLEFVEVIEPEFMEVSEFEFIEVMKPEDMEFMKVTEFEFMNVTEPKFFVPTRLSNGMTIRGGKAPTIEHLMCGRIEGFPVPKECWFKGQ